MSFSLSGALKSLTCAAALSCCAISFAQADTLRVGTEATFAPFEFAAEDGSLTGFDVEIMKATPDDVIGVLSGEEIMAIDWMMEHGGE